VLAVCGSNSILMQLVVGLSDFGTLVGVAQASDAGIGKLGKLKRLRVLDLALGKFFSEVGALRTYWALLSFTRVIGYMCAAYACWVGGTTGLQEMVGGGCPTLETLNLSFHRDLEAMNFLAKLPALRVLVAEGCQRWPVMAELRRRGVSVFNHESPARAFMNYDALEGGFLRQQG